MKIKIETSFNMPLATTMNTSFMNRQDAKYLSDSAPVYMIADVFREVIGGHVDVRKKVIHSSQDHQYKHILMDCTFDLPDDLTERQKSEFTQKLDILFRKHQVKNKAQIV